MEMRWYLVVMTCLFMVQTYSCRNDILSCANDLLSCWKDLLLCGNDFLSLGNEVKILQKRFYASYWAL